MRLMAGCTFEFDDQIAHQYRGCDAQNNMNVRFRASNFVNVRAGQANQFATNAMVDEYFNLSRKQGRAGLGVPDNVQIDFAVVVVGHGCVA